MKFLGSILLVIATSLLAQEVAGKRILLAFDGSGQCPEFHSPLAKEDRSITNVLKLHLLAGGSIDPDKTKENVPGQVSLYIQGIGAQRQNIILRKLNGLFGRLWGQQMRPINKRLEKIYEEGDQIYITGFSRGAASARKFAAHLNDNGLKLSSGKKINKVPVELVGVFDTVSMQVWMGIFSPITRLNFLHRLIFGDVASSSPINENGGQPPGNVKKAVHAVSMDDPRPGSYDPTLMDCTDSRVHEVWFPGNHGDVGGSWYKDGLSNGSGRWMKQFMEKSGLVLLAPEQVSKESLDVPGFPNSIIDAEDLRMVPDPTMVSHVSYTLGVKGRHRRIRRAHEDKIYEGSDKNGIVRVHKSALKRILFEKPMVSKGKFVEGKEFPYKVNPTLAKANFVVVGDLDEELPGPTEALKQALLYVGDRQGKDEL